MSLSVLMSVYQKEKSNYFNDALYSIWDAQTLKPDEIVLIKDGPLNEELNKSIIFWKEKLGSVLKLLELETNSGLAKALNKGIQECSCDFIARMDSDDICSFDRFEKQVSFLTENPNVMLLGGAIREFNEISNNLFVRIYPRNTDEVKRYLPKASPFAHASVMFRRSIFYDGLKYSESYQTSQDIDLWFKIIKSQYEVANLRDIIYYVRVSKDFYSRRSRRKALNEFKIYWDGIISLFGYNWRLIYPLLRFLFRISPGFVIRRGYNGKFRSLLN